MDRKSSNLLCGMLRGVALGLCWCAANAAMAQVVAPAQPSSVSPPASSWPPPATMPNVAPPASSPAPVNPYVTPSVPFDPYASPAQQAPVYPSPYPAPYPVYPAPPPYGQPIPYAPYGVPPLNDMIADLQWNRRVWGQFDYLVWWAKGNPLPALVTTSPSGTPLGSAGILPEGSSTSILFGNQLVDTQARSGGRIQLGYWLSGDERWGVEGQYFGFGTVGTNFNADSSQFAILARPFANVSGGTTTQEASVISYPGFDHGSIDVSTTSFTQGAGLVIRRALFIDLGAQRRIDFVGGYRYFQLNDSVTIDDQFSSSFGAFPRFAVAREDAYSARNVFNGGDVGLKFQQYYTRWSIEMIGRVALGNNSQTVNISGITTFPGGSFPGGLLTGSNNLGTFSHNVFALLPEADLNFRFDVGPNLRAVVGYTFIYVNHVQRSGDAINTTLVSGAPQAFAFHESTLWLQGLNFGFELRF